MTKRALSHENEFSESKKVCTNEDSESDSSSNEEMEFDEKVFFF